jgi:hypothetical protein
MARSLFQNIVSFASGVSEAAAEKTKREDELLKERVKSLQAAALEQNKTRYKSEFEDWNTRSKEVAAVKSAGPMSNHAYLVNKKIVKDYDEAQTFLDENPNWSIPKDFWNVGEEPIYATEVPGYEVKAPSAFSNLVRSVTGREQLPSGEEQLKAQMAELQARPTTTAVAAEVGMPSIGEEPRYKFPTTDKKAPEVKEFYDAETGAPYKAEFVNGEWRKVGGTKRDADSAPKSFIYYDEKGNEARAIWTGNESDMAGGLSGFKQMGATKATSTESGAPIIKKIVDPASGQEVSAMYTNNDSDVLFGQKGWVQFGGLKKDEGSVAREKWEKIQAPIYNAIKEGTPVSPNDWAAFKLYTLSNRDAIGVAAFEQLGTLEKLLPEEIRIAADDIIQEKTPATPKPKTPANTIEVGTVMDGWVFMGGDPGEPSNWQKQGAE